jgi:cytochrome c553
MATTSTAVSSAPRCDQRSHGLPASDIISNPIELQATRASVARVVFRKALAALVLILGAEWLGASPAFATPPPATDLHGGLVATCAACHGAAGEGSSTGAIPRLAGQNADYLAHALSMFKDRTRASPVMQSIAQNLSDNDMRQLADYFAAQHPPLAQAAAAPNAAQVETGRQLAQAGDGASLAACFACHAGGGTGNGARFPSIAGQPASFTVERLHEFQARAKKGAVKPGSMTAVAAQMTDTQIEAAAAYLSTLPR